MSTYVMRNMLLNKILQVLRLLSLSIVLVAILSLGTSSAQDVEYPVEVAYLDASVSQADGEILTLLDGSNWQKSGYSHVLPASDILIILLDEKGNGVAFSDGNQFQVKHISGQPVGLKEGWLSKVVKSMGDGSVLKMVDGSMWEIPEYDQFDTGFWLPPYHVIITSDRSHLINVKKSKKIWARQVE